MKHGACDASSVGAASERTGWRACGRARLTFGFAAWPLLLSLTLVACGASPHASALRGPVHTPHAGIIEAPVFGGELYVLEAGPRDAPPIVFVHGLGEGASRDFEPLFSALSERYHLLAFDLPGFGRSTRAKDNYTPPRYAEMIHELVARRFRQPVTVIGHSMGGAIAALYASTYPDEVQRLAVLDVAGVLHYRDYMRLFGGPRPNETIFERARRRFKRLFLMLGLTPFKGTDLSKLGVDANSPMARYLSSNMLAALAFIQYDFGPALRAIRVPTWIGWGRHDRIAPERTARALRYLLSTPNFHVFEGSEHVPMRSEPIRVLHTLVPFLAGERDVSDERAPLPQEPPSVRCQHERGRVIEGDYDLVHLDGCKDTVLRNVRARSLFINRSAVTMENVELRDVVMPLRVHASIVNWTGGHIEGETCMELARARLNFMAVSCSYQKSAAEVSRTSRLMASICEIDGPEGKNSLHGEYALYDSPRGPFHRRE